MFPLKPTSEMTVDNIAVLLYPDGAPSITLLSM